ncbi:thiosulfate sulfurtransferase 16, chloroplastic-like [Argentina anserina]|uniref:thiosulfate sulfurtransferase 16, chloroplastic-like n=1 Tax=Argentina anserina TaxID=57926 RepID=UPI00217666C0|nr:thiosulfate sulfurtransferase 16, chloroplastic-like [Potentilla anserina]
MSSSSTSCFTGSVLRLPSLLSPQSINQKSLLSVTGNPDRIPGNRIACKNFNFCPKASLRGNLEVTGPPASVPVRVAHELLLAGHKYLDVRTPEEFSAGRPSGAVNVPYLYKVGSGMSKNPDFVKEVSSHFRKHDEIIVGCQLGKRSMMAATDLVAAGFTGITDIAGGYASWNQNGLPTEL